MDCYLSKSSEKIALIVFLLNVIYDQDEYDFSIVLDERLVFKTIVSREDRLLGIMRS